MKKTQYHFLIAILVAMLAASSLSGAGRALSDSPAQIAERIRASLVQAQLSLASDPSGSVQLVKEAEIAYQTGLSAAIVISNSEADRRVNAAFETLVDSVS